MAGLDIVLPISVTRIEKSLAPSSPPVEDESHDAGFAAGYEEGRLRAEWEARRLRQQESLKMQAIVKILENLHTEYENLLAEHLPDLIHGALGRVFRQHPFTPHEIATEVAALLKDMEHAGRIALECEPTAADELRRRLEECDAIPDGAKFSLAANTILQPGEFLLKSDLGDVDGRHSSRIRQIHHALEAQS